MSVIDSIQQKIFLKQQQRKHRKNNADKAFVALTKANNIGIVYDYRNQESHAVAVNFYKQIKKEKRKVKILLFISEKRSEVNLYNFEKLFQGAEVFVICPEDMNLFAVPKKHAIDRFIESPYDIVFRLDLFPKFELDMVILNTRSKMYAGAQNADIAYLDFGIELSANAGLNGLTSNLMDYLNQLNNPKKSGISEDSETNQNKLF